MTIFFSLLVSLERWLRAILIEERSELYVSSMIMLFSIPFLFSSLNATEGKSLASDKSFSIGMSKFKRRLKQTLRLWAEA